jgi:hypothetical protein
MAGIVATGDVGVADVLTAMCELEAGPRTAGRIAALLGFELRTHAEPLTYRVGGFGASAAAEYQPELPKRRLRERPDTPRMSRDQAPRVGERATDTTTWRRHLTPVGREFSADPSARGEPSKRAEPLPADDRNRAPLPFQPLLAPRYTARIVQCAASTDAGDGDLDLEAVVEILATRTSLERWPLQSRASMLRGVQLLVDAGESMTLFERDCIELADAFADTVGRHLVEELSFTGSPWRGAGSGTRSSWGSSYVPPPPGTPVVALSDLNIPRRDQGRVDVEGWLALQELLVRRGSHLVVFVPFPAVRWPKALRGRIRIVEWDRGTSPSTVLKALAAGSR